MGYPNPQENNIEGQGFEMTDNAVNTEIPKEQIRLDIKQPRTEIIYDIKRRLSRVEAVLEIIPFWKNFLTIFTICVGLFTPVLTGILIFHFFGRIKDYMPLFYNESIKNWDTVDKSIFALVPVGILFFNVIIIRLAMMIYNFDHKLVYIICTSLILINVLALIGFIQLLSFVLV